jgi:signal transduction histidine kinase
MSMPPRRILPRRTVRLRLTALYCVLFLVSGAVLLAIASGLVVSRSTTEVAPAPGQQAPQSALAQAQARIHQLQDELAAQSAPHASLGHLLLFASLIALGIMTVLSLVLGWAVADRVLRPLRQMTAATRRISADSLHERLAMTGPADEMKELADTIDGLLERLEGAFAAQRRFVANASHELRTPLTTMRASLDVAMAKPGPVPAPTIALAGRLRTELDQVDRLLEGFLVLARAQHGALADRETFAFGNVVSAALAARAGDIAARNLTVHHAGTGDGWVEGSETLLRRMVDNVVDNAIGHNRDGGWIRVATGADRASARLIVETGGDVLDQQQVAQLAQPFRRLGAERTGSDSGAGLGLSIVAAIAAAHGGTLDLHARAEGGLRVSIALPLAAPGAALASSDGRAAASPAARAGAPT